MTTSYLEFTDLFRKLSPYDLNHLSETLLCKIENGFEGKLHGDSTGVLTEKDIKFALTEAMRDISLELREREISNEHLKLDHTKSLLFSNKRVAA